MSTDATLRDPRLRAVAWRDLCTLGPGRVILESTLSLPWLAVSLWLAHRGLEPLALPAAFLFFLCGLRQVHGAFHGSVGLSAAGDRRLLLALSALMLCSMHAVRWNHLRHHARCLGEDDLEAEGARGSAWRALRIGPRFPFLLHAAAWRRGDARLRRRMLREGAAAAGLCAAAFSIPDLDFLRFHVAAMATGQCLTAFFAVWTVHHGCHEGGSLARTVRGAFRSFVTYDMFYHLEHHLFPAVPTCRLPRLAERLDRVAPDLAVRRVF